MRTDLLTLIALIDFRKCLFVLVGLDAFEVRLVQVNPILQKLLFFVFILENEPDEIGRFIASATMDSLEAFKGKLL